MLKCLSKGQIDSLSSTCWVSASMYCYRYIFTSNWFVEFKNWWRKYFLIKNMFVNSVHSHHRFPLWFWLVAHDLWCMYCRFTWKLKYLPSILKKKITFVLISYITLCCVAKGLHSFSRSFWRKIGWCYQASRIVLYSERRGK